MRRDCNFCGVSLAERGWAVRRLVVAVRIAPEICARWENALVLLDDLETSEGVGLGIHGGVGRGGGVLTYECNDPDDHEEGCDACENGTGQSPRLRVHFQLHG